VALAADATAAGGAERDGEQESSALSSGRAAAAAPQPAAPQPAALEAKTLGARVEALERARVDEQARTAALEAVGPTPPLGRQLSRAMKNEDALVPPSRKMPSHGACFVRRTFRVVLGHARPPQRGTPRRRGVHKHHFSIL
jgi:hypothetical protein